MRLNPPLMSVVRALSGQQRLLSADNPSFHADRETMALECGLRGI